MLAARFEYARAIHDPLGLLVFSDVGKLGEKIRDLGLTHLKHSFGVGVTLRAGNLAYLQLYYAWGGGEGSHRTSAEAATTSRLMVRYAVCSDEGCRTSARNLDFVGYDVVS